jgi:uncharacterized protein (TIGR02117 family)
MARRACVPLALGLLSMGCAGLEGRTEAAPAGEHRVYVTGHGQHTGLAVHAQDVPRAAWPARPRFPEARYIELGWGDSLYYPEPDPGVLLGVRALLWPTESVVHAVGAAGPLQAAFPGVEIVPLKLTREGLDRLIEFVAASHQLDAEGRGQEVAASQRPDGVFYASPRRFHLFETCNTWVARALQAGGLPVSTRVVMSGGLMREVRALSERQHRPPAGNAVSTSQPGETARSTADASPSAPAAAR